MSPAKFASPLENHSEKPDSQVQERIKEDEVSSSEEAFKTDCSAEDAGKDGNL